MKSAIYSSPVLWLPLLTIILICIYSVETLDTASKNATIFGGVGTKTKIRRRPLYNIAHMVNSLKEIDDFLARGANAFESNVFFAPNATPAFVFHGYPCDCFRHCGEREKFEIYLARIKELTTPGSNKFDSRLMLLMLDMKMTRVSHSAKALAGENLAKALLAHLYNNTEKTSAGVRGSNIKILISIDHIFDYDFVLGFQNEIESQGRGWLFQDLIGWDIGLNDPVFAIESLWKRFDTVKNIWQGDGRSNCLSPFYNLARLSQILRRRDSIVGRSYIKKVYQWTVDLTVNIRTALRSNVDAILTNHPERIGNVIKEREFQQRYRLARASDNPWEVATVKGVRPIGNIPAGIKNPALPLKLANGAGDMIDSLAKYVGDFLRHRTPVKYFFLSSYTSKKRNLPDDGTEGISVTTTQPEIQDNHTDSMTTLEPPVKVSSSNFTGPTASTNVTSMTYSIVSLLTSVLHLLTSFRNFLI